MKKQSGFTIIEVTLFLALSGLLVLTLLGGWTTMIDTQRYRDSIKTLQSFVQQQYNLVYNVENGRNADLECTSGDVRDATETGGTGEERGQSDCVLMGRYIHIDQGQNIKVYAIVGSEPSAPTSNNDIDSIKEYDPARVELSLGLTDSELTIPWQTTVVGSDADSDPRSLVIAIIRTPTSGIVHSYSTQLASGTLPDAEDLVTVANESNDMRMCLDAGTPLSGGRMGVVIKSGASAQSFVQTITDDGADAC